MTSQTGNVCVHGRTPSAVNPCRECIAAPSEMPTVDEGDAIDPVDVADEALARGRFTAIAARIDELRKHRKEDKDVDHMGENMLAKQEEIALKWFRVAREIHESTRDIEHDKWLAEEARRMRGSH